MVFDMPRFFYPIPPRTVALLMLCAASTSQAAIYSCVDGQGRRLTSDRPIVECATREQRMLNTDGSVRKVMPPSMTPEEQAEAETKERKAAQERAAFNDAVRRDRNLVQRFTSEASHQKARDAALDDVAKGVKFSESRILELQDERKPLLAETEFYTGKQMPLKLRQQLDANDAATSAQRSLVQNQKDEILRIDQLYDQELLRLKKLWAGAAPGSLETPATAPASVAPSTPAVPAASATARRSKH
jgi:hypothetical protein